jgi:predicted MFS family arabinose efflux permease
MAPLANNRGNVQTFAEQTLSTNALTIPSDISSLLSHKDVENGSASLASSPAHDVEENANSNDLSKQPSTNTAATICFLLIGVFVVNIDSSLVLATNSVISSSFSQLQTASWLTTSYVMATCAAQPIIGKLSDIFSRKSVLLVCYVLFALGNALCGLGKSMWQVIAGRAIAGLGGAGMTVIVAVLITDLVLMREVVPWRSYVNIVATTGRMVGGPRGR